MGYSVQEWGTRIAQRTDMTLSLTHLTRPTDAPKRNALDVLFEILRTKMLTGSTTASGFIVGRRPAVCFQEAPIVSVCQNVWFEQKQRKAGAFDKVRYAPIGLQFSKRFVFGRGGRPVVYERTADAKALLPEDQWWRIVNFDLTDKDNLIDWTHEREWRVPGDFKFELKDVTVLLARPAFGDFVKRAPDEGLGVAELQGLIVLDSLLA